MLNAPRLLVVEDNVSLTEILADLLQDAGYRTAIATTAKLALERARAESFDLLLVDVNLPDMSGFEVCRRLRQEGSRTPLLLLTARGQTADKVLGLRLGADDYLTKPFDQQELLARLDVLLRRRFLAAQPGGVFRFGPVEVDFGSGVVSRDGYQVDLSSLEHRLLFYLIAHRGTLIGRQRLLADVWEHQPGTATRTVDTHVASLRAKLEPDPARPRFIITERGRGYRFES